MLNLEAPHTAREVKALLIAPDGSVTPKAMTMTMRQVQEAVGGNFEALTPPEPASIFVNEDGHAQALPYNWLATTWLKPVLHPSDRVVGNVLVAGPADASGAPTDIPEALVARLTELAALYHR